MGNGVRKGKAIRDGKVVRFAKSKTIHDSFICPEPNAYELDQVIGLYFGEIVGARCLTTRNKFDLQPP